MPIKQPQIFIDPVETPTEDKELERLDGEKQYDKYLSRSYYIQSWQLIRACIPLSPIQRIIVALRFFENEAGPIPVGSIGKGHTFRQISSKIKMPLGTVHLRFKEALLKYKLWHDRDKLK